MYDVVLFNALITLHIDYTLNPTKETLSFSYGPWAQGPLASFIYSFFKVYLKLYLYLSNY